MAEKVRPEDYRNCGNGVVYTAQPVPVGEVWRITVLSTTRGWSGGLVSGWVLCSLYFQRVVMYSQWPTAVWEYIPAPSPVAKPVDVLPPPIAVGSGVQ